MSIRTIQKNSNTILWVSFSVNPIVGEDLSDIPRGVDHSDNTTTHVLPTEASEDSTFSYILLFLYILFLVVIAGLYYLKTKDCTDISKFVVLLLSGLCNVFTGLILFEVKTTPEFTQIDGLLILIQPLMGLKGNLEMTMASRMSTLINLREETISWIEFCKELLDDIILVESQAIVISLVTVFFAFLGLLIDSIESFNGYNVINLSAISLLTSTTACLLLGIAISLTIVFSKKLGHDPDDFATPLAASLGDLVTLGTMIGFVFLITHLRTSIEFPIEALIVILAIIVLEPILIILSYGNTKTRPVLIHGWTPIIIATIISSISGLIFTHSNSRYQKLATFQPLFNGFAGNCLALVASRISTSLHRMGNIGEKPEKFNTLVSPYYAFLSEDNRSSRTTTLLLIIVIPSQLLYILIIDVIQKSSEFKLTFPFAVLYLTFAFIQIGILLYFAYNLTHCIWYMGYDPDTNAIPILTALADLSGTLILFFTYYLLETFQDINAL